MFLIVGLGNPGEEYTETRHNVGFSILDALVGTDRWHESKGARAHIVEEGNRIYVKPQTYMNESGVSVAYLVKKYDIEPENIMIIHDELAVPLGEVKVSYNKGTGGNNGVESIHQSLGTKEYVRVRVGIQPTHQVNAKEFVLKKFKEEEKEKVMTLIPHIEKAISVWTEEGREKLLSTCN